MIYIKNKSFCCGCAACVQICPKKCISLTEDTEGFLYPRVDKTKCIDCGLCETVCPFLSESAEREPKAVYAVKNPNDDIRQESSSGGVFTLLAEKVINDGGVVFGVRFDEKWEVEFAYSETIDGLSAFRGSKYIQARVGNAFIDAEQFLKAGRKVLFSGTPCQVKGLLQYLRKDYENLLTVDFVCHGVPSPKVWRLYLKEEVERIARQGDDGKNTVLSSKVMPNIKGINFRDKSSGWKKYSFALQLTEALAEGEQNSVLHTNKFYENPFMQAFLSDLILRPSCYMCPAKSGKSGSDITIGDFWGIEHIKPEIDDDKGLSLVMVHNEDKIYSIESIERTGIAYSDAVKYNPAAVKSVGCPTYRDLFFRNLRRNKDFLQSLEICQSRNLMKRARRVIFRKFGL
jgi:NAD-dependent dihydropyrimidine dehydrogenase PreA subunit